MKIFFQSLLTTGMLYFAFDLCANFCLISAGNPLAVFISLKMSKKDFANHFPVSVTIQMSTTLEIVLLLSTHSSPFIDKSA